jgi:serine/threonine protein kinase
MHATRVATGRVYSARERVSGRLVAIKHVNNIFSDTFTAKRALMEVHLGRLLRHPNLLATTWVGLAGAQSQPGAGAQSQPHLAGAQSQPGAGAQSQPGAGAQTTYTGLFLSFELMDCDLHKVIVDKSLAIGRSMQRVYMYQLLSGLAFMHEAGVIHRDVKPYNVLVNRDTRELKLCDFGISRPVLLDASPVEMTGYVVTRYYRAPEVCAQCTGYTAAIDVWSCGCILGELMLRHPLFKGDDDTAMLKLMVRLLGKPDEAAVARFESMRVRKYLRALPEQSEPPLTRMQAEFPGAGADALDLMLRLLEFDPTRRISAREALAHPFFLGIADCPLIRDAPPAPEAPGALAAFMNAAFDFDRRELSNSEVRATLYRAVVGASAASSPASSGASSGSGSGSGSGSATATAASKTGSVDTCGTLSYSAALTGTGTGMGTPSGTGGTGGTGTPSGTGGTGGTGTPSGTGGTGTPSGTGGTGTPSSTGGTGGTPQAHAFAVGRQQPV